jgi:cytochrome c biogenesis protein
MFKTLNSRRFAVYLLSLFLLILFISALIPNNYTLSGEEWFGLERNSPTLFWIYSHFSTPFLVNNPFFQMISFLLFLSTSACTLDRILRWHKSRASEFEKEEAFSFSATETSRHGLLVLQGEVERLLSCGHWAKSVENGGQAVVISGQKGMSGFWGSIAFHVGLLFCFLAVPVTALTGFRGELILTEDVALPLRSGVVSTGGKTSSTLPDLQVQVRHLRGKYFEGRFKYDFGGTLTLNDRSGGKDIPFWVNKPATYGGYQFSLQEYGNAPRLVLERDGRTFFDYYLNLRHPDEGDYFELDGGVRAFVMFFPDFFREGNKIGSRSKLPNNPVTLVRLYRGDREVFKGLFKPGDERMWEGARIRVPDYRHWVTLIVTRDAGIHLVIIGSLLGVAGLLVRFMSNERRIEFELSLVRQGTRFKVRGYSRYYPAFLEKEVADMAARLREGAEARG